jgi:deoxyribodipyrimidine photo-lyase
VVADAAGLPLALFPKEEFAARTLRPKVAKERDAWLKPLHEPRPKVEAKRFPLPFEAVHFEKESIEKLVAACAIDHDVPAVAEFPGGRVAGLARLKRFLRHGLGGYVADRNEPSRDATSHLSPYLHFGNVSAREVALAVLEWAEESRNEEARDAFLEQLLVRRGLAYNFAARNRAHRTYDAIPEWAKTTLAEHQKDKREYLVDAAALEAGETPDEVWNAAQIELRTRGVIHNYARMLWGKLVIPWMKDPRAAHEILVHLNDKYALDGRDPDGYASISWCFGLHDRPWPTRPCFGKVRSMTSRSAQTKLDLDGYLSTCRALRREHGL